MRRESKGLFIIKVVIAVCITGLLGWGLSSLIKKAISGTNENPFSMIDSVQTDNEYEYGGGIWNTQSYLIEEKVIDSCEYIIIFGIEGLNIIHKANCNNPFHYGNN